MSKLPKVTGRDMRGVMAYPPTPALPGAERVDAVDTVDLAETERMIRTLINEGVDAIALNGTLGEMATLTLEEWKAFAGCVAETVRAIDPDFPVFIGATTLNTRDTVARMRFLADEVIGTLLGRPMWGEMVPPSWSASTAMSPRRSRSSRSRLRQHRGVPRDHPRSVYRSLVRLPRSSR